jgi:nucleotide-binding universal stress UspA family protein
MKRIRRILHASDFSPASAAAFAKAVELARASRAELLVAHGLTVPVPFARDGYVSPSVHEEIQRSTWVWGQKGLDALVARAKKAGVQAKGLLLERVAHARIIAAAKSKRADLIVMGIHGRGGLAKFICGSQERAVRWKLDPGPARKPDRVRTPAVPEMVLAPRAVASARSHHPRGRAEPVGGGGGTAGAGPASGPGGPGRRALTRAGAPPRMAART